MTQQITNPFQEEPDVVKPQEQPNADEVAVDDNPNGIRIFSDQINKNKEASGIKGTLPPLKSDEVVDVTKEANVVISPQTGVQKDINVDLSQKPKTDTEIQK